MWFVLPAFIFYLCFFAFPFLSSIYLSFTDWNGIGWPEFTGLANWLRFFTDGQALAALWNNIVWVVLGTAAPIAIGLVLAVMLWSGARGSLAYRTIYFLPVVLSPVVIGLIWGWIYNPLFGLLNTGLRAIGLGGLARGWLGGADSALYAVLTTAIWSYVGFCIVVLFAGLQKVDSELLDAARVDGASAWKRFKNVIIPQIRPVLTMVIVYTVIGGFNVFDVVWVMTGGGPNNRSRSIVQFVYEQGFKTWDVGYAAAASEVLFLIIAVVGIAQYAYSIRGQGQ